MSLIPRSGSRSNPTFSTYEYWQYDASQRVNRKWEEGSTQSGADLSTYSGYSIPGFHRRVRKGELMPHTPWEQTLSSASMSGSIGPLSAAAGDGTTDTWWSTGVYPILSLSPLSSSDLAAYIPGDAPWRVQEAAAKIYDEGHDSLTFLAELASTKRMFLEAGSRFLKLKIPRNWRQMSNDWLSYRYGWRTFMYDCEDIHKALSRLDEKRTRYSKRSKNLQSWTEASGSSWQSSHAGTAFDMTSQVCSEYEVSIVGTVNADIVVPAFNFNPVVTAWELIPYSFVVDWFLGVGTSIAALSFLALSRNYVASWGCKVTKTETTMVTGHSIKGGVTGPIQVDITRVGSYETRVPCSVPLTPQTSFKVNMAKVVDLLAMISQKI